MFVEVPGGFIGMYAIVKSGGKQYKVSEGDTLDVELIKAEIGEEISLDQVLMVAGDDEVQVGQPNLASARVSAVVLEHGKGKKKRNFKYNPRKRYRRLKGHRQPYTRLRIEEIQA